MKSNKKNRYSRKMKYTAQILMLVFTYQLVQPTVAMALTTGPSQPEVQGFEPVGTTDMVDMFSGSFVYNIPLLDVEGYPVNISYHGGITMEQEASWVGLGWNINPGTINRTVRGVPDDFNGDSLFKDFNIKEERTVRVGVGVGGELAGVGDPLLKVDLSLGANVNISNYRGVSCDFDLGGGVNVLKTVSAGVNLGVGSQTGASIDYHADLSNATSQIISKDMCGGFGLSAAVGGGYSTRSGLKDLNLSFAIVSPPTSDGKTLGFSSNCTIPIGMKNYVPVITNSSTMNTITGRIKLGGEAFGALIYGNVNAMVSTLKYNNDASRNSYGYLYLQNASIDDKSILDFTRDKDGMFNKSMQYLPVPNMTYDIYNVSGQGTGGMFRPFRNDFGNVYDPYTSSKESSNGGEVEAGVGDLYESGWDYNHSGTTITSGPWLNYKRRGTLSSGFTKTANSKLYENVFFKEGGELTSVNPDYFSAIGGIGLITPADAMGLPLEKPGSDTKRDARANLIYCHTAQEDTVSGVGISPSISSYSVYASDSYTLPTSTPISRIGTGNFQRKKDQISEIVQVQKDGRKYVYSIPAMNNVQREVTFSVDRGNSVDLASGIVAFGGTDATKNNPRGRDNYYNSTVTPSYAHSYLLTYVLSNDYVDVTGDGPTDDDLGSFTKFNYTRTDSDYRWVAPYSSTLTSAQYNPGFWSDPLDDKGSFVCGSREQWNLQSVETKNFIAEFYTSVRHDAQGITAAILNNNESSIFNSPKTSGHSYSYKLDSIKMYNKHDRIINQANAIPIKSVFFTYDYSLCANVPNSDPGYGKLTLKKIYFSYGTSQKSMISPYQFMYNSLPNYDLAAKDRWGNYKPNRTSISNYEFPYVNQGDTANNSYASAWTLSVITLPSGGVIKANFESNDYAFVQDSAATEMFMVNGVGNSPNFTASSQLYQNTTSPNLYAYFSRRPGSELSKLSFAQNYLGLGYKSNGMNCVYFNFNVRLTGANNTFEQIKGYANVTDIGKCGNDTMHGYIKFNPVNATGSEANLNPITYTALNVARYNLPQIVFPGSDPDESDLTNVLAGLKESFGELTDIGQSPVLHLLRGAGGQNVNLNKCYIRLQSPGLRKKGGGQRVKMLTFQDNWMSLAGGNEADAYYGKQYDYTTIDSVYGNISSGVASYEPLVGGDENPLRQPIPYIVQNGSNFPPNDPVDLYQEYPLGESLFPPGQVGYSQVTVTSIHADIAKSSQSRDLYQFYTAKDFPAQVIATHINSNSINHYDFFSQKNALTATQGYTLIFNDMHGKPKRVEHDLYDPVKQQSNAISYTNYKYRQNGSQLNNTVKCLVSDGSNMTVQNMQLGVEEDVTIDSRQKDENTNSSTLNGNFNFFIIPCFIPIPVPIPLSFTWGNNCENEFQSAVVSKVVQQYGILDHIESYNEGAITTMQNEIFDPQTGQAVVTSITNEFKDKEYTTNIPAYWAYKAMGPSYNNIGYKDTGKIIIGPHNVGAISFGDQSPLVAGDELSVYYTDTLNIQHHTTAWILGVVSQNFIDTIDTRVDDGGGYKGTYGADTFVVSYVGGGYLCVKRTTCTGINILPRFPLNTPGWSSGDTLTNVHIEVISSGQKNMLHENIESYTSMDYPVNTGTGNLNTSLTNLIGLSAKTFADSNTAIPYQYIANADTINPWAIGERGEWRLYTEYVYKTDRNYSGTTARNSGLFNATGLFVAPTGLPTTCFLSPYNYLAPYLTDQNWHRSRTVTKYSPQGKEIENVDAVGNYSTAVFGYNEELPVAVASNSKQGEIFTDGFEDYNLLRYSNNIMGYQYSPFNIYSKYFLTGIYDTLHTDTTSIQGIIPGIAHTGTHSLYIPSGADSMSLPLNNNSYSGMGNNYNYYFPNSPSNSYLFTSANEYLPFKINPGEKYIVSYWIYKSGTSATTTNYPIDTTIGVYIAGVLANSVVKKSNIIDGWQQVEATFTVPLGALSAKLILPVGYNIDDIRIFPSNANMKSFVYNPFSEKLMATLDENNFATLYEYDQEGNLTRVKKETTKGIMTVSESRSGNPKQ